jgi:hypothetical protein
VPAKLFLLCMLCWYVDMLVRVGCCCSAHMLWWCRRCFPESGFGLMCCDAPCSAYKLYTSVLSLVVEPCAGLGYLSARHVGHVMVGAGGPLVLHVMCTGLRLCLAVGVCGPESIGLQLRACTTVLEGRVGAHPMSVVPGLPQVGLYAVFSGGQDKKDADVIFPVPGGCLKDAYFAAVRASK